MAMANRSEPNDNNAVRTAVLRESEAKEDQEQQKLNRSAASSDRSPSGTTRTRAMTPPRIGSPAGGRSTPASVTSAACEGIAHFHISSCPASPAPAITSTTVTAAAAAKTKASKIKLYRSTSLPVGIHPHGRTHREQFLIFTRILFKCLDDHPSPSIKKTVKTIIVECTKRNRAGDPDYHPLIDAVQARLRHIIGEVHWHKAEEYLVHYLTFRRGRQFVGTRGAGGAKCSSKQAGVGKGPAVVAVSSSQS
mmetsp:Transcript_36354/g.73948  ORF Transcript_36354/g.73948 Transcript_36354/m.73948 type:complete len:250 (-) Transcript_36354:166-915(-)